MKMLLQKNEKMKKENLVKQNDPKSISPHIKNRKIRLLPNVFYLRWELELISAFVMIIFLSWVPARANYALQAFFSGEENDLFTYSISVFSNILIIGFCIYIILRLLWIYLISKHQNSSSERKLFIKEIDQVAEMLISICIILLVTCFFTYMIYFMISYFKNEMTGNIGSPFKMNQ